MNQLDLYIVIAVAGFLPTYIWRLAAVYAVSRIDPESDLLLWVRSIATALVAALVVRLVMAPPGALADVTLLTRVFALGIAVCAYYAAPGNRAAIAVAAGSATILFANLV
jgi:hypothetical protein